MNRVGLLLAALVTLPAAVSAADTPVSLTLDGRPVDRHGGAAVLRSGVVCADIIDLTRSFDGLITLQRSGAATVTIGPNTGTFQPGSVHATVNERVIGLPVAPFRRHGDLFVPLDAFITRIAGAAVHIDRAAGRADIRVHDAPPSR